MEPQLLKEDAIISPPIMIKTIRARLEEKEAGCQVKVGTMYAPPGIVIRKVDKKAPLMRKSQRSRGPSTNTGGKIECVGEPILIGDINDDEPLQSRPTKKLKKKSI